MTALHERLLAAIEYSQNFANSKPNIASAEKEHILGLCKLAIKAATALQSSGGEVSDEAIEAALARFTEYFVRNYPGPDTIIHDPKWHAPKIFFAAQRALSSLAPPAQPSGFVLVPVEPTRKMCDDAVHAAVHGSHGSPWFPHAWRAALKAAAAPAPIEQEG